MQDPSKKQHQSVIQCCAYSPNGQFLAVGEGTGRITIYDAHTYQKIRTHQRHESAVNSIAYSPDSKQFCSGSADTTLKVWLASAGNKRQSFLHTCEGHTRTIRAIAYHPNGLEICSGSMDGSLRFWNKDSGQCLHTQVCLTVKSGSGLGGLATAVLSVAYSSDGLWLYSGSVDSKIRCWDTKNRTGRSNTLIKVYDGGEDSISSIAYHPKQEQFCTLSDKGTLKIWDMRRGLLWSHEEAVHNTEVQISECQLLLGSAHALVYSQDGKAIYSGSIYPCLDAWNTEPAIDQHKALCTYLHEDRVYSIACHPNGIQFCSGSIDGQLIIWDRRTHARATLLSEEAIPMAKERLESHDAASAVDQQLCPTQPRPSTTTCTLRDIFFQNIQEQSQLPSPAPRMTLPQQSIPPEPAFNPASHSALASMAAPPCFPGLPIHSLMLVAHAARASTPESTASSASSESPWSFSHGLYFARSKRYQTRHPKSSAVSTSTAIQEGPNTSAVATKPRGSGCAVS